MSEDTINLSDYTDYAADFEADSEFDSIEEATAFVFEHQEHYPAVKKFVTEHDAETVAEFISLVPEYANGNVTFRSIAKTIGISKKESFDALTIFPDLIAGGIEPPRTFRPEDVADIDLPETFQSEEN